MSDPAFLDGAFWKDRRVLVTGHTGFKGSWLCLWLQELGACVTGLSDGVPGVPSLFELARVGDGLEERRGDVRDPVAVAEALAASRAQVVFHLAAQPLVRRSYVEPLETYETNVMGTANVLEAVRAAGTQVRALVIVTSDKCYAPGEAAHREDDPLGGDDPYSSSKACAELISAAYRSSFFDGETGPRVATARAGNVIGGGDWGAERLVPDLVRAGEAGTELQLRNPQAVRPWQHVLNPLSGYLLLAQELCAGRAAGAWNFGPPDEDARPVHRVVERLAASWPGGLAWSAEQGEHPHEAQVLRLDSTRAREELGWEPPVALEPALESVLDWHARRLAGEDMRAVTISQLRALTGAGASVGRP